MSGIEEIIQLIEEGMKKVTDGLDVLTNTCYRDIVKEEQLDSKLFINRWTRGENEEIRDKATLPRCLWQV